MPSLNKPLSTKPGTASETFAAKAARCVSEGVANVTPYSVSLYLDVRLPFWRFLQKELFSGLGCFSKSALSSLSAS